MESDEKNGYYNVIINKHADFKHSFSLKLASDAMRACRRVE